MQTSLITRLSILLVLVAAFSTPNTAQAGPFTDEMTKCLVQKTSNADKTLLIQWIFAAMSHHPDVNSLSNVSMGNAEELNRRTAELMTNLLAERCVEETKRAVRYEGRQALTASFEVLGNVAMNELMANPGVSGYMGALGNYVDGEKLGGALGLE